MRESLGKPMFRMDVFSWPFCSCLTWWCEDRFLSCRKQSLESSAKIHKLKAQYKLAFSESELTQSLLQLVRFGLCFHRHTKRRKKSEMSRTLGSDKISRMYQHFSKPQLISRPLSSLSFSFPSPYLSHHLPSIS